MDSRTFMQWVYFLRMHPLVLIISFNLRLCKSMQSPNSAQMPFFVGSDINYIAWQYVSGMTCKVPKQVYILKSEMRQTPKEEWAVY